MQEIVQGVANRNSAMQYNYQFQRLQRFGAVCAFVLFAFAPIPTRGAPQSAADQPPTHNAQSPTSSVPKQTTPQTYKYTNKLIGATSPYLLEHAHNPVNWQPWGAEALNQAKRENKLIFLSIGYSACHWCHVMAREDFENEEIARIMNANFVCIKVDREQRPDLDAQYMLATQLMTGSGGWPLSVFLTPDRKPFFGGTYFPPVQFKPLLEKVVDTNKTQPEQIRASADNLARAIVNSASASGKSAAKISPALLETVVATLNHEYDAQNGGFGSRPKFPDAPKLNFALSRYRATHSAPLLAMATTTLDRMAEGGIYDQLAGGFHRYSTDKFWRVPHFEKMLYDQAQLAQAYLDAYELTHNPRYRQVVEETLAFARRELRDADGSFLSTLDADSEGEEGKFYLWTPAQVTEVLGDDAALFCEAYGVTATGDLNGKSVLHRNPDGAEVSAELLRQYSLKPEELAPRLDGLRRKMLAARDKRVRPHTDDKVLASWNGLMISAFSRASQVLNNPAYRQTGVEAARFLAQKMTVNGKLLHNYRAGKAEVGGMLEDYAFVANGLLDLYAATRDKQWLTSAEELAARMTTQFGDTTNGGFYNTSDQSDLLARLKTGDDNATPSGNGMAAQVCARLAALTGQPQWRMEAARTVQAFGSLETRAPTAFPLLLTVYQSLGATAGANVGNAPGTAQLQAAPITATSGAKAIVAIRVRIPSGWHINAHVASDATLIPTNLRLAASPDAALTSVKYPNGQTLKTTFARETLSVYQGEITLQAVVQIASKLSSGKHLLHFELTYQPCNDRACLSPTKTALDVPLNISK